MFDSLRRHEYTGDRRCWPCTSLNAVLLVVVAVLVGLRWPPLSLLFLAAGAGSIWLRGYLVPYTPRIVDRIGFDAYTPSIVDPIGLDAYTPRIVDPIGLDAYTPRIVDRIGFDGLFHPGDRTPDRSGSIATESVDGERLLEELVDAGAVRVDGPDILLDPTFESEWETEMNELRVLDTPALTEATASVAVAADSRVQRDGDDEWVVLSDGRGLVQGENWLTRPVAIAETAGARVLDGRVDDSLRPAAAGALRMFLTECPDCQRPLEETTAASCCGGYTGPNEVPEDVIACQGCEVRLYTFEDRTGL